MKRFGVLLLLAVMCPAQAIAQTANNAPAVRIGGYLQPNLRFMCDVILHTDRVPGEPRRALHARVNLRL